MGKHHAPEEDTTDAPAAPSRPALRIVKGNPTPEEIAALTVVLAAAAQAGGEEEPEKTVGGWGDPGAHVRTPLRPGPGAWRLSGR